MHVRRQRGRQLRGPGNGPGQSFIEGNVVGFQRPAQSLIEPNAGVAIVGQRLHLRAFRARDVLLIQHHLVSGGRSQGQSFLVGIESLLLQGAGLDGGGISRARLLQSDHRVLHVDANLVDVLLQAEFVLPQLQFTGHVVGLRRAVAQRNVQRDTRGIVGKVAAEHLRQQVAITAGQISHARRLRAQRR